MWAGIFHRSFSYVAKNQRYLLRLFHRVPTQVCMCAFMRTLCTVSLDIHETQSFPVLLYNVQHSFSVVRLTDGLGVN